MILRRAPAFLAFALTVAAPLHAQIDCTSPDDLCTGDPCVIPSLTVIGPCVVDFGPRTVVVSGRLRVPSYPFGDLALSAGRIEVPGIIQAVGPGGTPSYSLTAAQDLRVSGRISSNQPGSSAARVTLSAGGNIELGGSVRGASLYAEAGGLLTVTARLRHSSHQLRGAAGVDIQAGRIDNRDGVFPFGSDLEISSASGDVTIAATILANHYSIASMIVTAAGDVSIQRSITLRVPGVTPPALFVSAGNDVTVDAVVRAFGGDIEIVAGGAVALNDSVRVDGPFQIAGALRVEGASVQVASSATLDATAASVAIPGALRLRATAGDMILAGRFLAKEGLIEATATGDLTASGDFVCVGDVPGCIGLSAGGTLDTSAGSFDQPVVPDCSG